jgi:long-chain acyl-CoA synthetase
MVNTTTRAVAQSVVPAKVEPGSLSELLKLHIESRPQADALVFESTRLTYNQLHAKVLSIAQQLKGLGLGNGERVGLLFPNHFAYVASFFAISGRGGTIVPINPLLRSEEIAHVLSDSQSAMVVVHERQLGEVLAALHNAPTVRDVLVYGEPGGADCLANVHEQAGSGITARFHRLEIDNEVSDASVWPVPVQKDKDLALLIYTSGTTGKPKGAMITHANILFAVGSALDAFDFSSRDRVLGVLPLCHVYGLTVVMMGIFSRGGLLVIQEKFDPPATLRLIQEESVSVIPMVPAMHQFLLMEMEANEYKLPQIRMALTGASALAPDLIAKLENYYGCPLIEGYGLTEATSVGNANPLHGVRKAGSVGPPFPGVTVAVFDEDLNPLPPGPGNVGEVVITGPSIMQGYFGLPEASDECLKNGWLLTGDLGYQDEDGYLYIVGRKKELIIRGGQNIYPREIEEVILRMEGVAEAAVIGIPDKFMGERVKAVVVPRSGVGFTEQQVKDYCAEHLAEYKIPRLVEFTDALPRNSTGKVLKRLLQ